MFFKKMAIAVALAFTSLSPAVAGLQISDTYIDFKGHTDFSVTLANTGHSIDSYAIELLDWKQKSGYINKDGSVHPVENIYTKYINNGLAVFPTSMVLRQGQTNTVRLRVLNDIAREQNTYRLVLKEVDKKWGGNKDSGKGSGVVMKFSHRIPVFLKENSKSIRDLNFEHDVVEQNGNIYLRLKNLDKQPMFINMISQGVNEFNPIGYVFTGVEAYVKLDGVDLSKPLVLHDRYTKKEISLSKK